MRIPIESWKLLDWQGPTSGVRFRITADDAFLARDNDDSGVEIDAAPKVFREVDCVVATEVIDGLSVKTITIPALWLFSTTDAIVNRTARYSAKFVTNRGADIKTLELVQSFQLPASIVEIFNPVPWKEIIRFNFPAAPVPIDRTTFSTEQILELIGGGALTGGPNAGNGRVAIWSGPITVDGAVGFNWQTIDNAVPALNLLPPTTAFNAFRIAEGAGNANIKVGGSPALFSTHLTDETGIWHRSLVNDAATRRWTERVRDGALGLQYSAYDNSNVLQSNTIFDPAGGLGFSDGTNPDFGYFYKASSAYHLGINAAGAGASGATKEITFTTSGVGINKSTAIGAQLHVVSGAAGRIAAQIDSAPSPSQPLLVLRNDTGVRYSFNHDGVATFGLSSAVKGRLNFAAATNGNIHSLEAPDTPAANVQYKLPATSPANGQLLRTLSFGGGVAVLEWVNPSAGGDVSSSIGSVIDNKLTRFDGTTGKLIQDSAIVVEDTTGSFVVPAAWTLKDPNGNEVIGITSVASAVNEWNFSNSATGQPIVVAPTGGDTDVSIRFSPKGAGINQFTKNMLFNVGPNALDNVIFVNSASAGTVNASFGFMVAGVGSGTASDGPYFFARGNDWSGFSSNQKGSMIFVAGNIASPVNQQGQIRFMTGNEVERVTIGAAGTLTFTALSMTATANSSLSLQRSDNNVFLGFTNTTASKTFFFVNDNTGVFTLGELGVINAFSVAHTTGIVTFTGIPVGPNSNPSSGNQLTRKTYVDGKKAYFNLTWYIPDPSTHPTSSNADLPIWSGPSGMLGLTATRCGVMWSGGSHTSGGSVTFHLVLSGGLSGFTVTLDNTNNTAFTTYVNDFADQAFGNAWWQITARSGTVSERSVNLYLEGFQTLA